MSHATVIRGRNGAIEQPKTFGWSLQRGDFTRRTWHCTSKELANALIPQLRAGNYAYTITNVGPRWIVEAELSALDQGGGTEDEQPLDTWELVPNVVEKEVLESDYTTITGLGGPDRATLHDYIIGKIDIPSDSDLSSANARSLRDQIRDGLRSVRVFAPVMRFTRTASRNWQVKASTANVGKVLGNTYFLTSDDDAALLPGAFLVAINGAPFTNSSNRTNMSYGWFKNFPTTQTASRDRVQIVQEWEFGLWSTLAYEHVTS